MPSWKKVIVSGSDAILKDLTLSGDISNASGDFTLDIDGDMTLDAGGADIILKNAGTEFGRFKRDTSDFIIKSATNNKDIIFRGVDNSATIDALTLDMSDAGKAIFGAGGITTSGTIRAGNLNVDSADIIKIARDNLSTANSSALTYDSSGGQFGLNANHVMALIQTVDSNGSGLNAATLDGQEGTHYRINVYNNSGTLLN